MGNQQMVEHYRCEQHPIEQFKVSVPAGKSGAWEVEKFKINEMEARRFNCYVEKNRYILPGEYTKISRDGQVVMSDTSAEIKDHLDFMFLAQGDVLVSGLGIGMVLNYLLKKDSVTSITVVEKSKDVLNISSPHYVKMAKKFGKKLSFINESIFDVNTSEMEFDYAWHDIWDTICSDNLGEMEEIEGKFSGIVKNVQMFWCKELCEEM